MAAFPPPPPYLYVIYDCEYRSPAWFGVTQCPAPGWFDSGRMVTAWFDKELVYVTEVIPKQLAVFYPTLFLDTDTIFQPPPITVIVYHPVMFSDDDLIFHPTAMRKLDAPDRYLKNEVIRVR